MDPHPQTGYCPRQDGFRALPGALLNRSAALALQIVGARLFLAPRDAKQPARRHQLTISIEDAIGTQRYISIFTLWNSCKKIFFWFFSKFYLNSPKIQPQSTSHQTSTKRSSRGGFCNLLIGAQIKRPSSLHVVNIAAK